MTVEKHPYKYTLSMAFIGVFSVALLLFSLMYFFALTIKETGNQKDIILEYTSSRFDTVNTELLTVFTMFSHLQNTPELQKFGESKNQQDMYFNAIAAQKQIAESMLISGRLNYYTISAVYISEENDLVVMPTHSESLERFAQMIGTEEKEIRRIYDKLKKQAYGHDLLQVGDPATCGMINYLTLQNYTNGDLLFVLSIDQRNFKETFGDLPCSDWMICSQDTVLVGKNDDLQVYQQMKEQIEEHDFTLPSTLAPLGFKVDGQNIIGAQFSEIGWTFFASYPPWLSGGVGQTFVHLLPLIVLIAGSVLLAKRLYRHLYAPVEELLTRMGGSLEEDVNEFDYIWKRTSQISQKAHQLDASLSHSQQKLVEQTIKNALLDDNFQEEELALQLGNTVFVVALAEQAEENLASDVFEDAKRALKAQMRLSCDQYYLNMGDAGFAMVFHCDDTQKAVQRIQELFAKTGISLQVQLRVALSSPAKGLKNLHMLMEQCNHLMEYRHNLPNQMFIAAEDVAKIYYKGYYYPLKIETSLVQMTLSGKEGALVMLEEVMHENLVSKILSNENKKSFAFALVSTINRIYQELQLEETNDYPPINELLDCKDTEQLLQKIRMTFARIVRNTSSRDADLKQDMGKHMLEYIQQNYRKDISLDDMAENLNVSPKYCSALFKKQTGQTFKKVLNEYRIEQAKQILRQNPDTKVGELALDVGFSSANTFIQVFKQYTGTTPHQFAMRTD